MVTSTSHSTSRRISPIGAEVSPDGSGTAFRVWAPEHRSIRVTFEDGRLRFALEAEDGGYFAGFATDVAAGTRYKLQIDGAESFPDPASRFQPSGVHGYSELVNAAAFPWTDGNWRGIQMRGQVIYEMHLGTFSEEGTWAGAAKKLEYLRDTGVTLLEVMPVADFPGRFGWGYDGVFLYAPAALYGTPDDMRRFVDRAHSLGIAVILDVVYNHLGPDGNYLTKFSDRYLSKKHKTDWGPGINFDGEGCSAVREFYRENAVSWIRDFHLDGLRLDATQDIHDDTEPGIIAEISEATRKAAGHRSIVLIGENEPQDTQLLRPLSEGGSGLDGLWNDDYHHSAVVAMTGKADAYYSDYRGNAQEFVSAAKYGYLFQGQWYRWQKKRRGTPTFGLPRTSMVNFIENHDQVANSAHGQRMHELAAPGVYRAMTALTLLMPGTPMLFQGQEFASSSRFFFFADHKPELAEKVKKGRAEFLEQWRALRNPDMQACLHDPAAPSTFELSRIHNEEALIRRHMYALHRDLLKLRREDPVISQQGDAGIDGAVLSGQCFVLRYFSDDLQNDRLLVVNLGTDLNMDPSPEPLLGPPLEKRWTELWSSDSSAYGGCGTAPLDTDENWRIPGMAAVVLHPVEASIENPEESQTDR